MDNQPESKKIRVLLADDHNVLREGMKLLLNSQEDMQVIGEAANGEQAMMLSMQLKPDLVLMDIAMPEMNGLDATRALKAQQPAIHILVLTMHEGEEYFFRILEAGASGYVLKGASSEEVLGAIRAVFKGGVYLYPTMAKKLVTYYLRGQAGGETDPLTPRERQVFKLIAEGKMNREIAEELVVSLDTVQTHRLHLMKKLNLHNRADLIKYAARHGLIEAEE